MTHPDIIVVGNGVVGAACARALARRGRAVTVIEAGPLPGTASLVAAGMLAPFAEAEQQDPLLALAVRARDFYAELAPALHEETQIDIGLWNEGILQVAFSEEEVTKVKSKIAWQRQSGFTAEWLSPEELRELAPGISPDALGAAYALEDGAVGPSELVAALTKSAELHGATVVRGEKVERVELQDGRVVGVRTTRDRRSAEAVVIAAGCWSGLIGGLPRPLSVQPVRGQIAAMDWPAEEPGAIVYGAGGYVCKRGDHALAGSTMEHAGFDPEVTDAGLAGLRATAQRIYPALGEVPVRHSWAGLRPGTPDGRPIIGPDPHATGLWYATGHNRNGILFAGYTGDVVADLIMGETLEHDLSCVTPARFWRW